LFVKSTGIHSSHLDSIMGLAFDDLEGLSVRHQREIFKKRVVELNRMERMKYKYRNRGQGTLML